MNALQTRERRRYYRINNQQHLHFIQSFENADNLKRSFIDFFTDDIGYTSFCFEDYVSQRKKSFEIDISGLLSGKTEHKPVEDALWTLSKKIKLLEKALLMISNGKSPFKDRVFSSQYKKLSQPIGLENIKGNNKTKGILVNFDQKIRYFFEVSKRVSEKSTLDEIYSEEFVRDFDIDFDILSLRRVYRLNHAVLAKLFIYLFEYLDEIIRVFNDVINGIALIEKPELWSNRNIVLSAGGIGFETTYKLEVDMILDVFISLDGVQNKYGQTRQLHQKVKVIRIEEHPEHYYVGTMFLGIKSKNIDLINSYIFNVEVSKTYNFIKTLPEEMLADLDFFDLNKGIE